MTMTERVLVTGGRGTLGRQLTPRLQQAGYAVRLSGRGLRPADLDPQIEWAQLALQEAAGWTEALADVDVVVHAATSAFSKGADVAGTRHLLQAASQAAVAHIVYISIVGVDQEGWSYYRDKLTSEQLIVQSGAPFTILRTTQFHDFVHLLLGELFLRYRIGFLPTAWRFQSIDTGEVADLLREAVQRGPAGHLADAGGPQILTFHEMAGVWMAARGKRLIIPVPFPFHIGKPFTLGHNLAPERRVGQLTWADWVQNALMPAADREQAQ